MEYLAGPNSDTGSGVVGATGAGGRRGRGKADFLETDFHFGKRREFWKRTGVIVAQ